MTNNDTNIKPFKLSPVQAKKIDKIVTESFDLSHLPTDENINDSESALNLINKSKKRIDRRINKNFKNIMQYAEFNLFVHNYTYREIALQFLADEKLLIALEEKLGTTFLNILKDEAVVIIEKDINQPVLNLV